MTDQPITSLTQVLPESAIALDVEVTDWRDAVVKAGDLLVASGSTTEQYTQDMLAALDKFGPYIVIAPGFALAHAQASDSVLNTGMSWLRLANPVEFGHKTNDPVTLVVGLASSNHDAHIVALQQVAMLISNPEANEELKAATDPAQLRATIDRLTANQ